MDNMENKLKKPSQLKLPTRKSVFASKLRENHSTVLQPIAENRPTTSKNVPASAKRPLDSAPRLMNHMRRRSKSVTDLRTLRVQEQPKMPPLRKNVSTLKSGQKRPAAKTTEDIVKPKMAKRIPDWDYKSRFIDLQGRFHLLEQNLKQANTDLLESNKENEEIKSQSDSSVVELMRLKDTHKKLVIDHEAASRQIVENKMNIEKLHIETREQKHSLSLLKVAHEKLSVEKKEMEIRLENTLKENRNLQKLSDDVTLQLKDCRSRILDLEAEVEQMRIDADKQEILRRKLHNNIQDLRGNIRVFCRIRAPVGLEEEDRLQCYFNLLDENTLEIRASRESGIKGSMKQEFNFDRVFSEQSTQAEVFEELSQLVLSALDGYNVCVFAYGQTGSGKTYTMQGSSEQLGMIPRTVDLIYKWIEKLERSNWTYKISASFLEIYNETIRDLLQINKKNTYNICFNEGRGTTVTNLKIVELSSANHLKALIEEANQNRAVAATDFNEHSSRSHAVTKIYIEGRNHLSNMSCSSSINLVDLAGSESAKTSHGDRLIETKNINRSLSNLETVMKSLSSKENHIPYRNSKLTFLLQSSLGGNSKTLMIVNISPFDECYGESIRALRFASMVKKVKMGFKKNKAIPSTPVAPGK